MNKLTVAQRDYLIAQLNQPAEYDTPDEDLDVWEAFSEGIMASEERMKKIIHLCTEEVDNSGYGELE